MNQQDIPHRILMMHSIIAGQWRARPKFNAVPLGPASQ